jgi:hypothetical protein
MRPGSRPERGERGIAMVVALLVLLVISLMAILLTATATVSTKISGLTSRRERALTLAQAGVAEAESRLRAGDVPLLLNPRMVTQVFNVAAGSVPVLGADSTGLATSQPSGSWLSYTTADRSPNTLTISYRTDAGRSIIYRYDDARSPAINTVSGQPIMEITSTGTVGNVKRTVVVDVVSRPPTFNGKGAYTAGGQIEVHEENGPFYICGYNHAATTPDWTALNVGRPGPNPGVDVQHTTCIPNEVGTGNQVGVWAGGSGLINPVPTGKVFGMPSATSFGQSGKYTGPWDALGMTQTDFAAWLPVRQSTVPANLNGAFYLDKDATLNNNQGGNTSWSLNNVSGQGFLYIDGQVTVNGTFFWKGLVYVNGQFQHTGKLWILGSLIGSGQMEDEAGNNGGCILYSKDAVESYLGQYAGKYVPIAWRELQ